MSLGADPFRVLGVPPGSSANEIRSAYRRLAKKYHPDAAGERALPRFLAIQAAYEALIDDEGRLRTVAPGGASTGQRPRWQADPGRARATRSAYRARRTGAPPPGPGSTAPGAGRRARPDPDPDAERRARRGPRKATPGSTSYDDAVDEGFEPDWSGAGWYGPSSGTYWTINPREYADPRKHGPEYQARARRAAEAGRAGAGRPFDAARAPATGAADEEAPRDATGGAAAGAPAPEAEGAAPASPPRDQRRQRGEMPADDRPSWEWSGGGSRPAAGTTEAGDADWAARDWRYGRSARPAGAQAGTWPRDEDRDGPSLADLEQLALRAAPDRLRAQADRGPAGRLLVALLAWPPLGLLAATAIDALTGCAALAPSCTDTGALLPLAVQPVLVVALAALPALAAPAAFASLAALAVLVPVTLVMSASGFDETDATARGIIALVAVAAYSVALGAGIVLGWRPRRPAADPNDGGRPDGPAGTD